MVQRRDFKSGLATPDIQLHCPSDQCNGIRVFRGSKWVELTANPALVFAPYVCSNCRSNRKIFAPYVEREGALLLDGVVFKFGEDPTYGPPTPNRLLKLSFF
jgi:hypothetical protein